MFPFTLFLCSVRYFQFCLYTNTTWEIFMSHLFLCTHCCCVSLNYRCVPNYVFPTLNYVRLYWEFNPLSSHQLLLSPDTHWHLLWKASPIEITNKLDRNTKQVRRIWQNLRETTNLIIWNSLVISLVAPKYPCVSWNWN